MFDNLNVNLRKNEGFLTYSPCILIPEYGQSNATHAEENGDLKPQSIIARCI